jgi:phosphoribosylformylglycinamidine synthase
VYKNVALLASPNKQFPGWKIFYDNVNSTGAVPPTLIISVVGKLKSKDEVLTPSLKRKGHNLLLIGRSFDNINASEFILCLHIFIEFDQLLKGFKRGK